MDFATYCDATNNTPTVIDNNQLILDVAIKPTRAAEFIYIPIRVVSTSASI
jgi:phage tail sheath protein FI